MQEKITQYPENVYAGVDVSKDSLDFSLIPLDIKLRVENSKNGINKLIRRCKSHNVQLVALEATGKYHRLLHEMLHEAGIPAAVINPFRSRQFADSMGRFAKTDTIDAETIARFAERMKPEPTKPPTAQYKALRELHTARRQVLEEASDLKRQLHSTEHPLAAKQIRSRIKMADKGRYPPPYSLRLTFEERKQLRQQAGTRTLSAYIRERLFEQPSPRRHYRQLSEDHAVLGELLEELGKTRLSNNLNQLAKACNSGLLSVTDETEQEINQACEDIKLMRECLIQALGLKPPSS
tara:strand:+ start:3835 stop:4716 length:882 start_codon:yes stop_codon:yes gene_type:complete